jgi:RimJ/RimL family protein N-acetyltransferase
MSSIATPRLLLRPYQAADSAALVRELNNFAVSQWTARIPFPYGPGDAEDFLKLCREEAHGNLRLAVSREGALIGGIGVEADEIGYWLAESHWGKGYGTEAARAVSDHAFEAMRLERMVARYRLGNEASRRILDGLGFSEIGVEDGVSKATGGATRVMKLELNSAKWAEARERRR